MISIKINHTALNPRYPLILSTPLARPFSPLLFNSISNPHQRPKISIPIIRIPKTHIIEPLINPAQGPRPLPPAPLKDKVNGNKGDLLHEEGGQKVLVLCGFGYWLQGFRCFPWLALNYYMVQSLNLHPSILQLVQYSANLPMVAKPLYGIISDAVYFGDAHRLPYISFGGGVPFFFFFLIYSMEITFWLLFNLH